MPLNGQTILARRKHLNLTRPRLAAYARVSAATIKRAENGHGLNASSVEKIADALGVTVDSLYDKGAA